MDLKKKRISEEIANLLLTFDVGDRIPTISELSGKYQVGNGTTQEALAYLKSIGAIGTVSRGAKGTIIDSINHDILLELSGPSRYFGTMPLPHSKRFEGLATGIIETINSDKFSLSMSYLPGSQNRLTALLDKRVDFMITSQKTAEVYCEKNDDIIMYCSLHKESYVQSHTLLMAKDSIASLTNNRKLRVGIDLTSSDQSTLTMEYFANKEIELVPIVYNSVLNSILHKKIDAAIWSHTSLPEASEEEVELIKIDEGSYDEKSTKASIIIRKEDARIKKVLNQKLDINEVKEIQNLVLLGQKLPMY